MAIIAGQVPPPIPLPPGLNRRVVVKFRPNTQLPYSQEDEIELAKQEGARWGELARAFPGVSLSPYFSTINESTLSEFSNRRPRIEGAPVPSNFTLYYVIDCPSGADPERIARMIDQWP